MFHDDDEYDDTHISVILLEGVDGVESVEEDDRSGDGHLRNSELDSGLLYIGTGGLPVFLVLLQSALAHTDRWELPGECL